MKRSIDLEKTLKSLDGQKYGAYKRTKGIYAFDQFHSNRSCTGGSFAPPSKCV